MDRFEIADLEATDADDVVAIASETGLSYWSKAGIESHLAGVTSFAVKLTTAAGTAGFLLARAVPADADRPDVELLNIGLRKEHQKKGGGKMLLKALIDWCRHIDASSIWLEVRASNNQALGFYDSVGFERIGTRKGFYSNPADDAIVMRLALAPGPGAAIDNACI